MWSQTKNPSQPRCSARAASPASRLGSTSSSNGATKMPRLTLMRGPTYSGLRGALGLVGLGGRVVAEGEVPEQQGERRQDHDDEGDEGEIGRGHGRDFGPLPTWLTRFGRVFDQPAIR